MIFLDVFFIVVCVFIFGGDCFVNDIFFLFVICGYIIVIL